MISSSAVSIRGHSSDAGPLERHGARRHQSADLGRADDLAVAHQRLAVAEVQPCALVRDREGHRRARAQLATVEIPAVAALQARVDLAFRGLHREAADQWPRRQARALVEVHEAALDPVHVGCGLVVPPLVRIDVTAVRAVRDDAGRRDLDVVDRDRDCAARLRARDRDRSHDRPLVRFGGRIRLRVEVLRRAEVARVAFDRLDREHLAGLHGSDRRVRRGCRRTSRRSRKALHRREPAEVYSARPCRCLPHRPGRRRHRRSARDRARHRVGARCGRRARRGRRSRRALTRADALTGAGRAIAIAADVTDAAPSRRWPRRVSEELGRIDIVAANAGIYPFAALTRHRRAMWGRVMDVNVGGAVRTVQACLPRCASAGYGRIVLTSSITGPITGQPGFAHYGASKAAMLGFMRSARSSSRGAGSRSTPSCRGT